MQQPTIQRVTPQAVGRKGDGAYRRRVPSALTKEQREVIKESFRAGRNCHQISCELSCSIALVLEIVLRDHEQWLKELDIRPTPPGLQIVRRPIQTAREEVNRLRREAC